VDAVLIVVGAVIGAVGSIVGSLLAAARQHSLAERERRQQRQELTIRELSAMLMSIMLGASRYAAATKKRDRNQVSEVAAWYFPTAHRFMERWFSEQLRVDVLDPVLRQAGDQLYGALVLTVLDVEVTSPDQMYLDWTTRTAEYFQRAVHAFLREGKLDPKRWDPPDPNTPQPPEASG
jgi:hypothetical protein